jgi:hypothetical protein
MKLTTSRVFDRLKGFGEGKPSNRLKKKHTKRSLSFVPLYPTASRVFDR